MGWDSVPPMVGLWRMEAMLEIGDHELVSALAQSLNPNAHAYRERRSAYWRDYGRALASASCCSGHGVMRWAGNCTGWPTGLVCRCSPAGVVSPPGEEGGALMAPC